MLKHDARKSAYKLVGKILYNERNIELAIKEARMRTTGHTGGAAGGHAYVSDPTAQTAVRLVSALKSVTLDDGWVVRQPERWMRVVKCAYASCYPYEAKAMRYYYGGHSAVSTGERFGMDESTVYRIRNEFLHLATELACQIDLVRVIDDSELRGQSPHG